MRLMLCGALLAMAVGVSAQSAGEQAKATLKDAAGQTVGEATLTDTPHGVLLHVELTKAAPGIHAFHIHQTGKCEAPFTSAGGHFNPASKQHGVENAMGMHAGDMPNIDVPASGALTFDVFDHDVTLKPGANSLLDADGSAIVIHAGADDYKSDPAGNAGARAICGIVTKG
jgi:superoxide dismutase, Cu-Zn family